MPQRRPDLIFEVYAPDGSADFGGRTGGRARLGHEGGEGAVEGGAIVGRGGAESEKVLADGINVGAPDSYVGGVGRRSGGAYFCCFGDAFAEDFDLDVTAGGVECDRHGRASAFSSLKLWAYCVTASPLQVCKLGCEIVVSAL